MTPFRASASDIELFHSQGFFIAKRHKRKGRGKRTSRGGDRGEGKGETKKGRATLPPVWQHPSSQCPLLPRRWSPGMGLNETTGTAWLVQVSDMSMNSCIRSCMN